MFSGRTALLPPGLRGQPHSRFARLLAALAPPPTTSPRSPRRPVPPHTRAGRLAGLRAIAAPSAAVGGPGGRRAGLIHVGRGPQRPDVGCARPETRAALGRHGGRERAAEEDFPGRLQRHAPVVPPRADCVPQSVCQLLTSSGQAPYGGGAIEVVYATGNLMTGVCAAAYSRPRYLCRGLPGVFLLPSR